MPSDASAYAALGLEAGAAPDDVDRAYKALIKQFHPDRVGGDAQRAAEINGAYRELRDRRAAKDLQFNDDPFELRSKPWRGGLAAITVLAVALAAGSAARSGFESSPVLTRASSVMANATAGTASPMDEPLVETSVEQGIAQAVGIANSEDELALTRVSRECHQAMRAEPDLGRLDHCAAFDEAVAILQDRDPLRDQGPFSQLAVTGRQMSSATLLSSDYLAIDGRLDRIRLRVELALAPTMPPPEVPPSPDQS